MKRKPETKGTGRPQRKGGKSGQSISEWEQSGRNEGGRPFLSILSYTLLFPEPQ